MFHLIRADSQITEKILPGSSSIYAQSWEDRQGQVCAYTYQAAGAYWMHWPGAVTFCFDHISDDIHYFPENQLPEKVIQDLFWRSVAPFILQVRGKEAIHASAVITKVGVAAFCAASGTGKSTLAYSLERKGYPLWTDDALVFDVTQQGILAIPLPFSLRLLPDTLSYFSQEGRETELAWDMLEKAPQPITTIIILERLQLNKKPAEIHSCRLSALEAFILILEQAFCFSLYEKKEKERLVRNYLALTEKIPVFRVQFSNDLAQIPGLIGHIEELIQPRRDQFC